MWIGPPCPDEYRLHIAIVSQVIFKGLLHGLGIMREV